MYSSSITPQGTPSPALRIWKDFILRGRVLEDAVPLFAMEAGNTVKYRSVGKQAQRQVLQRSDEMNELIRREVERLTDDWSSPARRLDGLIYMAGTKRDGTFVPFYIGKTVTVGRVAACRPTFCVSRRTPRSSPAGVTTTRITSGT